MWRSLSAMRLSRRFLLVAILVAAAAPAALAGPGKEGEVTTKEGAPDEKEVARSVVLGGLVFPVFTRDGKLKGYLFANARMLVAPGKDPWKYREKAHFIRDAVIRAAHRTSFNVAGDFNKLDEQLAARECLKAANEMVGEPNALVSMTFTQIASQTGR
jgi:hypothetical protein